MDQRNNNHHNNGGGGFFIGFLLGILVALLFTTKKGREVLKVLTEKGFEKFSDLEQMLDRTPEEYEEEEDDYVKPQPSAKPKQIEPTREVRHVVHVEQEPEFEEEEVEEEVVEKKPEAKRRFFKKK